MPDRPLPDDPLDEAFAAYLRSCDAGKISTREEFLSQFPELADQLRELMDAADLIGRVTLKGASQAEADAGEGGGQTTSTAIPDTDPNRAASAAAETVDLNASADGEPEVTLPIAHRGKDDPGPTLPFDLGDYQLLKVIGRGGMGVVYLAKQLLLDRMVAVKMIRSGIFADDAEVRRFYTEAQAAARLKHPGIVAVYQFGRRAGHHFFSMEYVEGTDLQRQLRDGPLDPRQAARYVRDVARAIDHAHQKGVLHRDLKPANVLIDLHDQVRVTDFGLAKHLDSDSSVTGSGAAVGTPHYMAPEQAGGLSERATHLSDVYALGAILFACLTGRPPIVADNVMQTLIQVVHQPAPPLRSVRADAPIDLETIVGKCLEKNPGKRYASAQKLADDLDAFLDGRPIAARPRNRLSRVWNWLQDVPLVAALVGRRALKTSEGHRRFQTAMLCLLLCTPFFVAGLSVAWSRYREAMPRHVRIAGGLPGGVYNDVSAVLVDALRSRRSVEAEVVPSDGSVANRKKLLAREVQLAPLQASAIRGEELCVIAPLFYEALHVLVRQGTAIETLDGLAGRRIAVGPSGSGSREVAEMLLDSVKLENRVARVVIPWPALHSGEPADVAIVCSGVGSPLVSNLLNSRRWALLPIPQGIDIALQHPTLRPMTLHADDYPSAAIPAGGIPTVGTTAFLAARPDAPSELVTETLESLYGEADRIVGLIPRRHAAEWQGLAFHPAARRFFDRPARASLPRD